MVVVAASATYATDKCLSSTAVRSSCYYYYIVVMMEATAALKEGLSLLRIFIILLSEIVYEAALCWYINFMCASLIQPIR